MAIHRSRRHCTKKRRKSTSRRSLVKCQKCCHVARNHLKLRRHIVKYHVVNTSRKDTKFNKRRKFIGKKNREKRLPSRRKIGNVSPGRARKPREFLKSFTAIPGCIVVLEDDNLKRSARRTTPVGVEKTPVHKKCDNTSTRARNVSQKKPENSKKCSKEAEAVTTCRRSLRSSRSAYRRNEEETPKSKAPSSKLKTGCLKSEFGCFKSRTGSSKSRNTNLIAKRGPKSKKGERFLQPHPCHLCAYVGRDSFNLRRHLQSKHEPKPPKHRAIYQCEQCDYKNKHRFLVKRHSAVHSREGRRKDGFACDRCEYVGGSFCNLKRHQLCRHEKVKEAKLQCSLCDHREPDRPALFGHFREAHGVIIETDKLEFDDFQSFMEFKTDTEKATFARFVRQQTRAGRKKHVIFKCHRDGMFKSKSRGEQRQRALKTTGSNKINSACPASMRMTIDPSGKVSVIFTKTHVGHSNEVCRLTLTKEEKILIAEMLESKRSFQEIISEIRNGMESERLERIHLLSRKDLQNIERWYKARDVEEPPRTSLDINIEKWAGKVKNAEVVRLYKKPATILPKPFKCLDYDDFILILANDLQLKMLKHYGSECICIDNTYENSQVKLTVLMVLDDTRQGFPCAFMLSSKIDRVIMKVFLDVVRKASGSPMTPSIFISGIPDYRRTEWSAVIDLPESTEVLYSPWSVDEDLKRNLQKVKNEEDRQYVYDVVLRLVLEKTPSSLSHLLEKTIKYLDESPSTELFGKYFKTKFAGTSQKWAACLRNKLNADARLGLESTHEILKFVYSEGQKNGTLEDCIGVLMTCCRDQLQDRIVLQETICPLEGSEGQEDDIGTLVDSIAKRHEDAVDMKSQPADSGVYEIVENNVHCRCGLRCFKCDVCIHSYRCTCSDSIMGWTICQHIHFCLMSNPVEQEAIQASHPFDPLEEKRKLLLEFENMCGDIAADGDSADEPVAEEFPVHRQEQAPKCKLEHESDTETVGDSKSDIQESEPEQVRESEQGLIHEPEPELEREPEHELMRDPVREVAREPEQELVCEPELVLVREPDPELVHKNKPDMVHGMEQPEELQQPKDELSTSEPSQELLEDAKSKLQSRFLSICRKMSSDVDLTLIEQALASIENAIASRHQT